MQENLLQSHLLTAGSGTIPGAGTGLRQDSHPQLFQRALRHQASLMNNRHVTAQALNNLQHVRSQKDRSSARDHALQHGFERAGSNGIYAFERLVEKKDLGPVNHGGGHGQLLLHAVGVVGDELFRLVSEVHEVQQFGGSLGGSLSIETVHSSGKIEKLGTCQSSEQRHALGHDSDLLLYFHRIFLQIEAENLDAP